MVYDRKEREESLQERDPFAIPEGAQIGDNYKVPFNHPKEGDVELTIFIKEGNEGEPVRYMNTADATRLAKKSRETVKEMLSGVKRYRFHYMGNVRLVRYDDIIVVIAAANRPIPDD